MLNMNNLPNDIIFNICRFLPYPQSKVFENISLPIDRMILNNEIIKFNKEYVKITTYFGCDQYYYNKELKGRMQCNGSERSHVWLEKMSDKFVNTQFYYSEIITVVMCFKCYYKYIIFDRKEHVWGTFTGRNDRYNVSNDIKIASLM